MFVFLYCEIRPSSSSIILNLGCRLILFIFIFFLAHCDLMTIIIWNAQIIIQYDIIYSTSKIVPSLNAGTRNQFYMVFCRQHHDVQVLCKLKKFGNHWSKVKKDWLKSVLIQKSKGDMYEAVWKNAVRMVNSDQQASHEVCSGHVASFVTSEVTSVNNYCKVISVNDLYFSSWSSSGLVKDFPCKYLIDIT
jgi:hypothetical protein